MAVYLAELYVARRSTPDLSATIDRVKAAAEELTRAGVAVRLLRSVAVPDDETCFLLYEPQSFAAVEGANTLAAITCDRIAAATDLA